MVTPWDETRREELSSLRGDRAISNARLKALGWRPRYPDFIAGFSAILDAGA